MPSANPFSLLPAVGAIPRWPLAICSRLLLKLALATATGQLPFFPCLAIGTVQTSLDTLFACAHSVCKSFAAASTSKESGMFPAVLLPHLFLTCQAHYSRKGHGHHLRLKVGPRLDCGAPAAFHLCPLHLKALQAPAQCVCVVLRQLRARESLSDLHGVAANALVLLQALGFQLATAFG